MRQLWLLLAWGTSACGIALVPVAPSTSVHAGARGPGDDERAQTEREDEAHLKGDPARQMMPVFGVTLVASEVVVDAGPLPTPPGPPGPIVRAE